MLILKSRIKELFTEAGLQDFTVARDKSGYLNLVGSCGKNLVGITNFTIGSKLSKVERDICITEHITPIINDFGTLVKSLVDAKATTIKTAKAIEDFKKSKKEDNYTVSNRSNYVYNSSKTLDRMFSNITLKSEEGHNLTYKRFMDEKSTLEIELHASAINQTEKLQEQLSRCRADALELEKLVLTDYEANNTANDIQAQLKKECTI